MKRLFGVPNVFCNFVKFEKKKRVGTSSIKQYLSNISTTPDLNSQNSDNKAT